MVRQIEYVRCEIERNILGGCARATAWVPVDEARPGQVLGASNQLDGWQAGWTVIEVADLTHRGSASVGGRVSQHLAAPGRVPPLPHLRSAPFSNL